MCGLDSRSSQSSICWNCWKHSFHNSPFHSLTEKYNHLLLYIVLSGRLYRHHGWHITGNTRKAKLTARTFSFWEKKTTEKKTFWQPQPKKSFNVDCVDTVAKNVCISSLTWVQTRQRGCQNVAVHPSYDLCTSWGLLGPGLWWCYAPPPGFV